MNQPLVTVFTLVYNTNPKFTIEAINSIYSQTYKNIEHIIINDNPEDKEHWPIIKSYILDNNLPSKIIENSFNKGICKNINTILEIANGKYILGCSDDIILKERIFNDVKCLEINDNRVAFVFSKYLAIDKDSNIINKNKINYQKFIKIENKFDTLFEINFIPAPTVTYKKEILKMSRGYDSNIDVEDFYIHLKLLSLGFDFVFRDSFDTFYRIHNSGFSQKNKKKIEFNNLKVRIFFANEKIHQKILEYKIGRSNLNSFQKQIIIDLYFKKFGLTLFFYLYKYNNFILNKIFNIYLKILKIKYFKIDK